MTGETEDKAKRATRRDASRRVRRPRPRPDDGSELPSTQSGTTERRYLAGTLLSRRPPRDGKPMAAAVLVTMFVVSYVYWQGGFGWLAATPEAVFGRHQYWRLLTTIAVHSDLDHWISNALLFGLLSYLLYGYFGVLAFPGLTTLGGLLTMGISLATYPPGTRLVGASGVVYWMAGFWLVVYFAVDRRLRPGARLLRCLGFSLALLAPTAYKPEVSYRTHGIGFVLGALFGVLFFFYRKRELRRAERYVTME